MSIEQVEILIDLIEIRMETFCVIDKEDVIELENMRMCRQELEKMKKKAKKAPKRSNSPIFIKRRGRILSKTPSPLAFERSKKTL